MKPTSSPTAVEFKTPGCPAYNGRLRRPFTVCCNSCDRAVPDAHFHCSTCDDGDFDLCQDCVNQGISCYNDQHWLIKRTIRDGEIAYSTTHVAPKTNRPTNRPSSGSASPRAQTQLSLPIRPAEMAQPSRINDLGLFGTAPFPARTCNSCVQDFSEKEFLHCAVCEDFDLCKTCFAKDLHGHHPKHGFAPAVKGTMFDASIMARLGAGRNVRHNAICDGCNRYIRGIRHKCLDCPDWDYCSECAQNAGFIHPNHRFAPIFEPLSEPARTMSRSVHHGICCDGPLCTSSQSGSRYIVGVRYKCAVCHDTDFCASCEASPANTHNKTHPLIKFKTPVRHVSVTTTGEHQDGQRLPPMGDRNMSPVFPRRTSNRSTETIPSPNENIAVNPVRTVVDVKPTEAPTSVDKVEQEALEKAVTLPEQAIVTEKQTPEPDLVAVFKHDTIEDGTTMPPNHTFEQTWVLRNEGNEAWPAGCSVKFVGGDYMGAVDPTRPTGVRELISASESTICYNQLQPGQEFSFTVLMRTPEREGKVISYWRLTTRDGIKFGHKLWCDVTVESTRRVKEELKEEESLLDSKVPEMAKGHMIIPKLDHESPASSVLVPKLESEPEVATETDTVAPSIHENDEFEECAEDDEWADDSDSGFMTDEEYDILDASDEEYLFDQQRVVSKK
jgi:next to BRCA1 gene 1 protein